MRWGVIGTGNMGSILIDAWVSKNVVDEENIWIHNRTLAKAFDIKDRYSKLNVCTTADKVVKNTDIIFICVKPLQVLPLLKQLKPYIHENHCIISITSPVSIEELETVVPCQTGRVIPSITNRAGFGVTLTTFSDKMDETLKAYLIQSLKLFSNPVDIDESITRVSSDIVSCGPAFISYLLQSFIKAAKEYANLEVEKGYKLAEQMIIGFGKLLEEGYYTLETLQEKVTVKGGVTGAGLKVLDEELGDLFLHVLEATHEKYGEDKSGVSQQLPT
ncbi:late competence protein ComER [Salirhabdus sp. Marseille-P4669]|uniref:late competence protein ComER n=1 Tax=Salirhabdus sp. Marseille-P4669 TaxID=2042310 RepID=UPI000C7B9367|nr:late competence protein ComER [Salirhabdus sp. Marseille-P4669]